MKRLILTVVLGVATLGLIPDRAQAQIGGVVYAQRVAQRQVISWYQAYLGRLPNAQELNVLSNLLLTIVASPAPVSVPRRTTARKMRKSSSSTFGSHHLRGITRSAALSEQSCECWSAPNH